jgi:hypothetical protein
VVLAGAGGETGEQVCEVGDLVVLGVHAELGGDGCVGEVVGGKQVRGVACLVPGALDGLAIDGQVAQAGPACGGFLAQPGAHRGIGLAGVGVLDRTLDGLEAGRVVAAGAGVAAQPAAGQRLLRHGGGELADGVERVRAAQLRHRDHRQDRLQGVADAAGAAVVGDLGQVLQQAVAAAAGAVDAECVQAVPDLYSRE